MSTGSLWSHFQCPGHTAHLDRDVGVVSRQQHLCAILPPLNGCHGVGEDLTAEDDILPGDVPRVVGRRGDLRLWGGGQRRAGWAQKRSQPWQVPWALLGCSLEHLVHTELLGPFPCLSLSLPKQTLTFPKDMVPPQSWHWQLPPSPPRPSLLASASLPLQCCSSSPCSRSSAVTAMSPSKALLGDQSTLLLQEKGQGALVQPEAGEDG